MLITYLTPFHPILVTLSRSTCFYSPCLLTLSDDDILAPPSHGYHFWRPARYPDGFAIISLVVCFFVESTEQSHPSSIGSHKNAVRLLLGSQRSYRWSRCEFLVGGATSTDWELE